jgi:hypothetical protein
VSQRYPQMDAQEFESLIHERQLGLLSINDMGQERLKSRMKSLREVLRQEHETGFAEEGEAYRRPQHVVLMAGLPFLWGAENEESDA